MVVDGQRAEALVEPDAGGPERTQVASAPRRDEQPLGDDRIAPSDADREGTPVVSDRLDRGLHHRLDPSRSNTVARSSLDSGSSGPTSRGPASRTVTVAPKRAKTWASSTPIAPPPMTASEDGTSVASIASRFVQYGVDARPSMGGAHARWPTLITTARLATYAVSPTSTRPGPSSRPQPRTKRPPLRSKRSTATVSSQSSVASSRMRAATGAQSGRTSAVPAIEGTRRASASRSAARIIILDGTHPQ